MVVLKSADSHPHGMAWMIPIRTILEQLPDFQGAVVEDPPQRSAARRLEQFDSRIRELVRAEHRVVGLRRCLSRATSSLSDSPWSSNEFRVRLAGFRRKVAESPDGVSPDELDGLDRELTAARDFVGAERARLEEIGARSERPETVGDVCPRPDCPGDPGRIDETGFCEACWRRPPAESPTREGADEWRCAGLVTLPKLNFQSRLGDRCGAVRSSAGEGHLGRPRPLPGVEVPGERRLWLDLPGVRREPQT